MNGKGLIAITDYKKKSILIFDKVNNNVQQVGDGKGESPGQLLLGPDDVKFINDDEILVADTSGHRLQQFNLHSEKLSNTFGRSGTGEGEFQQPVSVCMDGKGNIIVADYSNNRVQVLTRDGVPMFKFGDSGLEKLKNPVGCVCYKNMFIVADSGNSCLKIFNSSGKFLRKIGEKGNEDGQFLTPYGVCVDQTWKYFGQ